MLVPEIALTPQALSRFRARLRRRRRGAALGAQPGRAPRRVAAPARRRGPGLRRAALGGARTAARHRADRRRRGARRVLQARGRPALRRPDGRAAQGASARRRAARRQRHAAARERRVAAAPDAARRGSTAAALPPVEVLDMRGSHHPLHPTTRMALADVRRAGGKAIVLLNRRGWSNFLSCRACGRVWMCPECDVALVLHRARARPLGRLPPLRAPRTRRRTAVPSARRWRSRATAPGPSASSTSCARRSATRTSPCSASTPTRRRVKDRARDARWPGSRRRLRACSSGRRWWPRATTSPTSRSASCSTPTRRCASRTSAPRSARSR